MSTIDEQTRAALLRIARSAIAAGLSGHDEADDHETCPTIPSNGVFVTLRKNGHLRGCIGTFSESDDLGETVRSMAQAAARDPRFVPMPISSAELPDLRIEISVLSPLERIDDPLDFEPGVHGIYIRREPFTGCFLPDVATERGWDRETFLSECCAQKAGMDPLAWQEPDTEVMVFTVTKIADR